MKYLVRVQAESMIVVEAENEDDAAMIAHSECSLNCFQVTDSDVMSVLDNLLDLERAIRHSDEEIY